MDTIKAGLVMEGMTSDKDGMHLLDGNESKVSAGLEGAEAYAMRLGCLDVDKLEADRAGAWNYLQCSQSVTWALWARARPNQHCCVWRVSCAAGVTHSREGRSGRLARQPGLGSTDHKWAGYIVHWQGAHQTQALQIRRPLQLYYVGR